MRTARFQVYKAKDGWRWRLLAANNRQIAQGEAHTRERDAYRACEAVKRAISGLSTVKTTVTMNPFSEDFNLTLGKPIRGIRRQWMT